MCDSTRLNSAIDSTVPNCYTAHIMQNVQNVWFKTKEGDAVMDRVIGVTEARSRFGEIVDKVQYQGDTVVLEKNGKPAAALISFALFEKFLKSREVAFQVVTEVQEQNQGLDMSEDELLDFINEAVHEVRAQTK
jgi:prevent-host-death family protein